MEPIGEEILNPEVDPETCYPLDDFIGLSDVPKFNYLWGYVGVLAFVYLIKIAIDCA